MSSIQRTKFRTFFGFKGGLSQPTIEWMGEISTAKSPEEGDYRFNLMEAVLVL